MKAVGIISKVVLMLLLAAVMASCATTSAIDEKNYALRSWQDAFVLAARNGHHYFLETILIP